MNTLPSWADCELAVGDGQATALQQFIYDNEPAGKSDALMFRMQLLNVVLEAQRLARVAALAEQQ